jgi:hypothetical protein
MKTILATAAVIGALTSALVASGCTPETKTPKSVEEVQNEADFKACWRELQYRAAVGSGKSDALDAIKSVDMGPIYQTCLLWVGPTPKTELEKKRWAAWQEYRRCTGHKPWELGRVPTDVQSRCMAQVHPTCNAARYDPNTCLIPQPRT